MKKCCTCQSMKNLSDFNKNKGRKDGLNSICKECSRLRSRQYYSENREVHKKNVRIITNRTIGRCKEIVKNFKQNGCYVCNEDSQFCLDCHHFKGKKLQLICKLVHYGATKKLVEELKKCIVLCANCHRKLHAKLFSLLLPA